MVELGDFLWLVEDVVLIVATAVGTAFAQTYVKGRSDRIKVFKGFLQEVKQNIYLAKHNIEQEYGSARILFFRDDFWNMSKASGHFMDLPSNLQILLYEIYMKQYQINEDLNLVGKVTTLKPVQTKIVEELQPKLKEAQKLLEKTFDP